MKKVIKSIVKFLMIRQIIEFFLRLFRTIVSSNDLLHTMISHVSFNIKNLFDLKIYHIPFFIAKTIDSNSIIIDCGSNVGVVVKPLLVYPAVFYCFEPNPTAFKQLTLNLGIRPNLHLLNKAVGSESKTAKLFKHVSSGENELMYSVSSSLLANKPNIDNTNFYEVEVINFVEFLSSLNQRVKILKVDIEGAEVELVNAILDSGMEKMIDYIFIETHENTIPELFEPTLALEKRTMALNIKNIYYNWA